MEVLFAPQNLMTLAMLVLLQVVLGFDNLLYISLESKRVASDKQAYVRRVGIGIAIALRIILLFVLMSAIPHLQNPFFELQEGIIKGAISIHSLIVMAGGIFILYTALKEIMHMLSIHDLEQHTERGEQSVGKALFWIIVMNLIFSFDSILSAIALTDVFVVMALAIIVSGVMMIWLADRVAAFLQKNRMYEVLGLFVLFIVGIMLLSEGAHLANLELFHHEIHPMAKSTFYFVIAVLVVIDIVQSRYQKKLLAQREAEVASARA